MSWENLWNQGSIIEGKDQKMTSSEKTNFLSFIIRALLAICIALVFYMLAYRPLQMNWGATDTEIQRALPGDNIVLYPSFNGTRAVTVNAFPEEIWPWLMQIGRTRGGWYSYDLVDNSSVPSAERIIPELQNLQIGNVIPTRSDGKHGFKVKTIDPNHHLLLGNDESTFTWLFLLDPINENRTRLITRLRMKYDLYTPFAFIIVLIDIGDFPMMRQCMLGIKARAEGGPVESFAALTAEFVLWVLAFIGFIIAEFLIILRKNFLYPLILSIAVASITILLVLWKPPLWVDIVFVLAIYAGLVFTWRSSKKDR